LFQDISEYKCENGKTPTYVPHKPVTGVIGAAFSVVSIMVANILRLFKVTVTIDLTILHMYDVFSMDLPINSKAIYFYL